MKIGIPVQRGSAQSVIRMTKTDQFGEHPPRKIQEGRYLALLFSFHWIRSSTETLI